MTGAVLDHFIAYRDFCYTVLFPFLCLQTLELLFRITNSQNVTVIVEKMLEFLRASRDDYTITDLVGKVAELAEKYPFFLLRPFSFCCFIIKYLLRH